MSTFSGDLGPEEEDGAGWEHLVPSRREMLNPPEIKISKRMLEDIKAQVERLHLAESKLEEFDVRWDGNQYSFDPSGTYKR